MEQLGECAGIHWELGLIGCKYFKKVSYVFRIDSLLITNFGASCQPLKVL